MNGEYKNEDQVERTKLLKVFETVVRFGPISLDDTYPLVDRSRSATFRALKTLELSGWIRRTFNGRQYVATSVIDNLSGQGTISSQELDLLCPLLSGYQKQNNLRLQVGFYVTPKTFYVLECSEKGSIADLVLCPSQEAIACTAFCLLSASRQEKIFNDLNETLDLTSRDALRARVRKYSQSLQTRGYVCDSSEIEGFIGLETSSGQVGALSVAPRAKWSATGFDQHIETISKILADHDLLAKKAQIRLQNETCTQIEENR